jgi:hypothetical protein
LPSRWADLITEYIADLRARVFALEAKIQEVEGRPETAVTEEDMESERIKAISTISLIGMARRSVYGYAMLLDSLGLPKDQAEMVKQIEAGITSMMRLMQAVRATELAMRAFEAGMGPLGLAYLAMSGGMYAATMLYGGRSMGGN